MARPTHTYFCSMTGSTELDGFGQATSSGKEGCLCAMVEQRLYWFLLPFRPAAAAAQPVGRLCGNHYALGGGERLCRTNRSPTTSTTTDRPVSHLDAPPTQFSASTDWRQSVPFFEWHSDEMLLDTLFRVQFDHNTALSHFCVLYLVGSQLLDFSLGCYYRPLSSKK